MMAEANQMSQELNKATLISLKLSLSGQCYVCKSANTYIFDHACVLIMNKHLLFLVFHVCRGWNLNWRSRIWRCQIQKAMIWRRRLLSDWLLQHKNKLVYFSFCVLLYLIQISIYGLSSGLELLLLCPNSLPRYGCGPRPSLWTVNSWWKKSTNSISLRRAEWVQFHEMNVFVFQM